MRSSSLLGVNQMKAMHDVGITSPREYRDRIIHDWWLEPQITEHLDRWFLLRAKPNVIFEMIENGELQLDKRSYSVVWINRPSYVKSLSDIPGASGWALCSFRYCRYLKCGYVLIKVEMGATQEHIDILEVFDK